MKELGKRLRVLRESVGLSQAKLAQEIGSNQSSINRYENGQAAPTVNSCASMRTTSMCQWTISLPAAMTPEESSTKTKS